ncbi:MAG TPA: hypothetical protein VK721_06620 [Solirubrobacteraceae bacterium]|jgi:hypothetical protein|nr:hypothetical protein [Solirubrobacteraceae bacterium]
MAIDFTVIQPVRQRFGDDPSGAIGSKSDWDEFPAETNAPFVGVSKQFPFKCPSIDTSESGVLQFNAVGVSGYDNVIQVNDVPVPGGISVGPLWPYIDPKISLWNTQSQLVEAGVLGEDNVLYIASTADEFGNYDDFVIDNIVIWFKTRSPGRAPVVPGGVKAE